jgi:hypothetical protein
VSIRTGIGGSEYSGGFSCFHDRLRRRFNVVDACRILTLSALIITVSGAITIGRLLVSAKRANLGFGDCESSISVS